MAQSLTDITWSAPVLPAAPDPAWEAEVRRRGGHVNDVDRRIARCVWLRQAGFDAVNYRPVHIPARLYRMGTMVVSQENACRYCYGANRALMKVMGYSEEFIQRLERDLQLAELDARQRAYIAFARSLARSRPRPGPAACAALLEQGYSRAAVHEIAFTVSIACFYNRVATLLASPPERAMERMADGPLRRVMGLMMAIGDRLAGARQARVAEPALTEADLASSPFARILSPLAGLPAARVMNNALEGAFAPGALSQGVKALMFAVVARTLGCDSCDGAARGMLRAQGWAAGEIESALSELHCPRLSADENRLLPWARATVHYETGAVQATTREIARSLGDTCTLEAIGVASLANAAARLAMLAE